MCKGHSAGTCWRLFLPAHTEKNSLTGKTLSVKICNSHLSTASLLGEDFLVCRCARNVQYVFMQFVQLKFVQLKYESCSVDATDRS